jgi:hypothetical protein
VPESRGWALAIIPSPLSPAYSHATPSPSPSRFAGSLGSTSRKSCAAFWLAKSPQSCGIPSTAPGDASAAEGEADGLAEDDGEDTSGRSLAWHPSGVSLGKSGSGQGSGVSVSVSDAAEAEAVAEASRGSDGGSEPQSTSKVSTRCSMALRSASS